jgi:flagellar M-ring protein FliF
VEITLDMDFTRSEITSEEYLPDTALRSEQSSRQVNTNPVAAGIPGAVSNTPPADPEMADTKQSGKAAQQESSSSSSLTRNYEVSRRVETRHPQTGQITRVHAAVLLHRPEATSDTPPPALPLTDIEALTKSAIGFDPTRGDVVTVTSAAFVQNGPVVTAPRWYEAAWLPSLGRSLAQLTVLGIVVLGVVRPLLHRLLPPARSGGVPDMNLSEAIEVRKGETLADLRDRVGSLDDLNSAITYDEKIEVLRQMALSDTNRVTSVFKSMLSTPKDADQ